MSALDRRIPSGCPWPLYAPEDWERHEIALPRVPPSKNTNEIRSHWSGYHKAKKSWQEEIEGCLMASKMPRNYERAVVGFIMRFPNEKARRDTGNFTDVAEKALGDALANGRWIRDDDAGRFWVAGIDFEHEVGPARTIIVMFTTREDQ